MNRRQFLSLAAFAALPAPRRLVAFGDSITVGVGASTPERAYISIVARAYGRTLENRAVSGSRIAEQVEHIRATTFLPGDLAVLLAGYNDMRAGTPLDEYRAALREALALIPCPAIVGTCLRMTPAGYAFGAPRWNHGSDTMVAAYGAIIAEEAARFRVAQMGAVDPAHTADLTHPNDLGHVQIAGAMVARVWLPWVVR